MSMLSVAYRMLAMWELINVLLPHSVLAPADRGACDSSSACRHQAACSADRGVHCHWAHSQPHRQVQATAANPHGKRGTPHELLVQWQTATVFKLVGVHLCSCLSVTSLAIYTWHCLALLGSETLVTGSAAVRQGP